ncbi:hypothetical protein CS379_29845 [Methylobacterium frigidaeris]|uniref:Uncharacterized protein n=2 Tax=Methylobacterium frigidaeris TaxID=2038277 RepID=A0AA37M2K7_9HYPH|nr:hypothetical protein CS379_29845 [Methylobacterium frigidaeris]GJD60322.1 hypothetical protein MPEAHAMD_0458 [Methylobacterium frigidaeris]
MRSAISMRELQRMSAGAIQILPHAMPIKNGTATVGILLPIRIVSPEYMRKVLADSDAAAARRTPEENAAIDRLLAERGIE